MGPVSVSQLFLQYCCVTNNPKCLGTYIDKMLYLAHSSLGYIKYRFCPSLEHDTHSHYRAKSKGRLLRTWCFTAEEHEASVPAWTDFFMSVLIDSILLLIVHHSPPPSRVPERLPYSPKARSRV